VGLAVHARQILLVSALGAGADSFLDQIAFHPIVDMTRPDPVVKSAEQPGEAPTDVAVRIIWRRSSFQLSGRANLSTSATSKR